MPLVRPKILFDLQIPASKPYSGVILATPKAPDVSHAQPAAALTPIPKEENRDDALPQKKARVLTPSPIRWNRSAKVWKRRPATPPPSKRRAMTPEIVLTPSSSPPSSPSPPRAAPPPTPPRKKALTGELPSDSVLVNVDLPTFPLKSGAPKGLGDALPPQWQRAPSHLQQLRQLRATASLKAARDERIEALIDELAGDNPPLGRWPLFLPGPPSSLARRAAEDARVAADEARSAVVRIRQLCGRAGRGATSARDAAAKTWENAAAAAASGAKLVEGHPPVRAW